MALRRRYLLEDAGLTSISEAPEGITDVRGSQARYPGDLPRVRMARTSVLDFGYEKRGNSGGFPIMPLHGSLVDVRSWDGVAPTLVEAGYRALMAYWHRCYPAYRKNPGFRGFPASLWYQGYFDPDHRRVGLEGSRIKPDSPAIQTPDTSI